MKKVRAFPSLMLALPVLGLLVAPAAARAHVTGVVITREALSKAFLGAVRDEGSRLQWFWGR